MNLRELLRMRDSKISEIIEFDRICLRDRLVAEEMERFAAMLEEGLEVDFTDGFKESFRSKFGDEELGELEKTLREMSRDEVADKFREILEQKARDRLGDLDMERRCPKQLRDIRLSFTEEDRERGTELCSRYLQLHCQYLGLQPVERMPNSDVRSQLKAIESHIKSYGLAGRTWCVIASEYYRKALSFLRQRAENQGVAYQIMFFELRNRFIKSHYLIWARDRGTISRRTWKLRYKQRFELFGDLLLSGFFGVVTLGYSTNLLRFLAFIMLSLLTFALIYCFIPGSAVYNAVCNNPMRNVWDSIYFSVIVFTTLGFGDIVAGSHGFARMIVVAEVCLGYISLGVLISLIMKKLGL